MIPVLFIHSQQDNIQPKPVDDSTGIRTIDPKDSLLLLLEDSLQRDMLLPIDSSRVDSQVINNTKAVNLMIQSHTADLEISIKEAIMTELLNNEVNARRRHELEQQIEALHKEDSIRRDLQQRRIDSLKQNAIGAPVMLKYDTLYYLYTNMGAVSAFERANLQSKKILAAAKNYSEKTDSIHLVEGNFTVDLIFRGNILASISEYDALWMDTSRESLATIHLQYIQEAIAAYKKQTALWNRLRIAGLCILVIAFQWGMFKAIAYLFNHVLVRAIIKRKKKLLKGLSVRDFEILNVHRQMKLVIGVLRIIKYFIYIILLYLTIPLLFSIFPPTQKFAEILFGWILTPLKSIGLGFVEFLPDLFKIIIILLIVKYVSRFFKYCASEIEEHRLVLPGFYPDWAKATYNIIRIIIYALAVVMVFQLLPWSDSDIFRGVTVFLGLLVSLGSTSVISNLMAGMVITYMRPFIQGDRIRIGETYGDVIEKSPFVIRIKTPKNEIVTVPNSTVLSSNVINYSANTKDVKDAGVVVNTIVTMGYDVPWLQVNQILIDSALKTPFVMQKPTPFVLQTALNDFSVSYQINAYTKEASKMPFIYSELFKNIQDTCRDAGVEMISPHYQSIRDGNPSTVPPVIAPLDGNPSTVPPVIAPSDGNPSTVPPVIAPPDGKPEPVPSKTQHGQKTKNV